MGDLLRSEDMTLCQIFIPVEAAYFVVLELGEVGLVQFRDLNEGVHLIHRNFAKDVLRCYEMERILKHMSSEVRNNKINLFTSHDRAKAELTPKEITALEMQITQADLELHRLNKNVKQLRKYHIELQEFKHVLLSTENTLKQRDEAFEGDSSSKTEKGFQTAPGYGMDRLSLFTGVIDKERAATFERLVWRLSSGCALFKSYEIREPIIDPKGNKQYKIVFVICCHGDSLQLKMDKLCKGYRASLYTCPSTKAEREKLINDINVRLTDMELIMNQTNALHKKFLISVANQWENWSTMVKKIKAVYHTLNFLNLDVTGKCLIGECWVPVRDIPTIKQALADGSTRFTSVSPFLYRLETYETPPTYIRTNKYTYAFQNLINVYGTATYKEANPAMFLIITFPFLFAIMFGDTGHGLIMALFSVYLILLEKSLKTKTVRNEIFRIFFAGRYMILLMGIFSFYTGLIYNDNFSISLNIFKSSWFIDFNKSRVINGTDIELHPKLQYRGSPYVLGLDPAWGVSHNEITFLNSFKMKVSIIIGVIHMILGLCISIINHRYFGETHNIILEFIPRMLLLCSLFLWLVILMFIKWFMYSAQNTDVQYGTACAPSILVCFIDMMLFKKSPPPYPECQTYLFPSQRYMQMVLIFIAVLSIPMMFLGHPLYTYYKKRKMSLSTHLAAPNVEENASKSIKVTFSTEDFGEMSEKNLKEVYSELNTNGSSHSTKNDKFKQKDEPSESMGESLVIQAIDTIEYALGTVSHTASYLRLWALSLAHNELSAVLWDRLLCIGIHPSGYVGGAVMFVIFFIWMAFTVMILILMEGLSAFLHTLRLHWVEFMSKFYKGQGVPFQPLSFKTLLEDDG